MCNVNSLEDRSHIHSYETRNKDNVNINFYRLNRTRDGTSYLSLQFYNALPSKIKSLNEIKFKMIIKKYLLNNAFYSAKEFLDSNFSSI